MDITPLISADRQVIQAYSQGAFKISGQIYNGSVIVSPGRTMPWPVQGKTLTPDDFAWALTPEWEQDVILLGCGPRTFMPDPAIRALLKSRHINLELMDTGAACRTYNVLMADGRRIAAALLPL